MNIYDFTVTDYKGEEVCLDAYKGKVLLVVNTATKCGLTPQYKALEGIYEKYKERGFEVLDFPCNQFKEQAPQDDAGITEFCVMRYGTTFPRFKKIDVNGENAAPLYVWLKECAPEDKKDFKAKMTNGMFSALNKDPDKKDSDIKWNFGKFLINKEGNVVARFAPATSPKSLQKDIESLL